MIARRPGDRRRAASLAVAARPRPVATLAALVIVFLGAACGGSGSKPGGAAAAGAPSDIEPSEAAAAGGAPAPAGEPAPSAGGSEGEASSGGSAEGAAPIPGGPNRREVLLFFQRADDDMLGPEQRKIFLTESITDQAKQIVSELIGGPREEGLLPTVPSRTTVLGFYLDRTGTAYLDLSEEIVTQHPGGSAEELATIFSIVDSLTYNLPEIKRVRFLVAGEERDTLKNHLDLRRAYLKNMSIVRLEGV